MKILRCVVVFLAVGLCLFVTNLQAADPMGRTLVYRGNDGGILWFFWDGDQTVVYISSEDDWGKSVFCDGNWVTSNMHWQVEEVAGMKINQIWKGPLMARVFYPMTLAEFDRNNWTDAFLCNWVQNQPEDLMIAEGIVHFNAPDINTCAFGPGRNSWGWSFSGSLINLKALCPGNRVSLKYQENYQLKMGAFVDPETCTTDESNIILIKQYGPALSCEQ